MLSDSNHLSHTRLKTAVASAFTIRFPVNVNPKCYPLGVFVFLCDYCVD